MNLAPNTAFEAETDAPQNSGLRMEDQMASRSMVPFWRNTSLSPWGEDTDAFSSLRREMNRFFDNAFARSLTLPFGADPNQVKAAFKNGVLTVTTPKPQEVQQKRHRIEVQRDTGSGNTETMQSDREPGTTSPSTASAAENKVEQAAAE